MDVVAALAHWLATCWRDCSSVRGSEGDMWEIPKTSIIALHRVKNESNDEGARDKIRTKTLRTVTQPINKEY